MPNKQQMIDNNQSTTNPVRQDKGVQDGDTTMRVGNSTIKSIYSERSDEYKFKSEMQRLNELESFKNRKKKTISVKQADKLIRKHKRMQLLSWFINTN